VVFRWKFVENGKDFEIAVEEHVVTNDGAVLVDAARASPVDGSWMHFESEGRGFNSLGRAKA